jgi:hypothetical protein
MSIDPNLVIELLRKIVDEWTTIPAVIVSTINLFISGATLIISLVIPYFRRPKL